MTIFRLIAPDWLMEQSPSTKKVLEGRFSDKQLKDFNTLGYNIYFLPNSPSEYQGGTVDGSHIDTFTWVIADMDLKDGDYASKDDFLAAIGNCNVMPTKVIDSGHGIHAYWQVSDLDAMSFLRLTRRVARMLVTDDTVATVYRLMRYPGYFNTKQQDENLLCEVLFDDGPTYTCEEMDRALPNITTEDETYCQTHFDKTYSLDRHNVAIADKMPDKWGKLLAESSEATSLWAGGNDDRSKNDYRLGHIMFAKGFTKDEAATVLANSAKALTRAPIHRLSYASNIVDKIWTYEAEPQKAKKLSYSVADLLSAGDSEALKGTRFPCYKYFDGTELGFRLGQVLGLVAGVGVGKSAISLNIFKGFVEANPNYIHIFVSLEMPGRQIAMRWQKMSGKNTQLHSKVHILSNYNDDGTYRNLSLQEIQDYVLEFEKETGQKVGCVCVDHIGVLKQKTLKGEFQGIADICQQLKSFAIATNTFLIMQSQTSRQKSGVGDLELFKDAAYGTQKFEEYLDFLVTCWQPLKRCYDNKTCPRVTAYKFAKIREKSENDTLIEDQNYKLLFETSTETLRPLRQEEEVAFDFFAKQALNLRKKDLKSDLVTYQSTRWTDDSKTEIKVSSTQIDSDRQSKRAGSLN